MRIVLVLFLILNFTQVKSQEKHHWDSPLKIPLILSGTFGELRSNHFHSGIDFKTNKETGIPIFASASGYVSRIKVSPTGFGKAIYIAHENGLTTVYAHLENFNKEISQYILQKQYDLKTFSLDLNIDSNKFKIEKGDNIGYTGNSGSSSGPHLHFEIRNTKTQHPLNPMNWDFEIKDTKKPIIESVFIYKLNDPLNIEKENMINQKVITGQFSFGIKTYDLLDLAENKNGINTIKIYLDNQLYYHYEIQEFSFNETKYINSLIDYKEYKKSKQRIYKCYVEKNNQLSVYKKIINNGIFKDLDEGAHSIKIIVEDSYKNNEEQDFVFIYKKNETEKSYNEEEIIDCNKDFSFENENIKILIPQKSLYTDCVFSFEKNQKSKNHTEYTIMSHDIPLHKSFQLSIKPDTGINQSEKLIMVQINNKDSLFITSKWKNGEIVGNPSSFGIFTLTKDEEKPKIEALNFQKDLSKTPSIRFKISDNLSGINEYFAEIDGKWILMEYDAKNQLIEHNFINKPDGKHHKLYIKVSDKNGNFIEKEFDFVR